MYNPYTDEGLRKLMFAVHTPRDIDTRPTPSQEDIWLRNCLLTVYALYGYAPLAVVARLYNTHPGYKATSISLLQDVSVLPPEKRDFTIRQGQIFSSALDSEELQYLQSQPQQDYYVPNADAIAYATLGVMAFMDSDVIQRTIHSLEDVTGITGEDLFPILHAVVEMLSHDQPIDDITMAMAYFQKLTNTSDQDRLRSIITWLDRRVPKLKNKGYTDAEREKLP